MKIMWLAAILTVCGFVNSAQAGDHQLGLGAHYWRTIDDIEDDVGDVDEDGIAWVGTYQYRPSLLGLGLDVEWKESGFGGATDEVIEPQAYFILGESLYGAAGIGGYYSDGDFAEDPFYLFRAGLDLELIPAIHLDLHAIYRFESWDSLHDDAADVDSDTITFGAAARLEL